MTATSVSTPAKAKTSTRKPRPLVPIPRRRIACRHRGTLRDAITKAREDADNMQGFVLFIVRNFHAHGKALHEYDSSANYTPAQLNILKQVVYLLWLYELEYARQRLLDHMLFINWGHRITRYDQLRVVLNTPVSYEIPTDRPVGHDSQATAVLVQAIATVNNAANYLELLRKRSGVLPVRRSGHRSQSVVNPTPATSAPVEESTTQD